MLYGMRWPVTTVWLGAGMVAMVPGRQCAEPSWLMGIAVCCGGAGWTMSWGPVQFFNKLGVKWLHSWCLCWVVAIGGRPSRIAMPSSAICVCMGGEVVAGVVMMSCLGVVGGVDGLSGVSVLNERIGIVVQK